MSKLKLSKNCECVFLIPTPSILQFRKTASRMASEHIFNMSCILASKVFGLACVYFFTMLPWTEREDVKRAREVYSHTIIILIYLDHSWILPSCRWWPPWGWCLPGQQPERFVSPGCDRCPGRLGPSLGENRTSSGGAHPGRCYLKTWECEALHCHHHKSWNWWEAETR